MHRQTKTKRKINQPNKKEQIKKKKKKVKERMYQERELFIECMSKKSHY